MCEGRKGGRELNDVCHGLYKTVLFGIKGKSTKQNQNRGYIHSKRLIYESE